MSELQPLNHPIGTREMNAVSAVPVDADKFDPIRLPQVEIHTAIFEVPRAESLTQLPQSLHPSMPSYATVTCYRVPESDIGPFEFAIVGLACRSAIRPRMMTLSSFATTDAAIELLSRKWGFAPRKADVRTRLRYDAACTDIELNERTVFKAVSINPETLLGTSRAIRYPQALNYARYGAQDGLLQFDIAYEYNESYRGVLTLPAFDAAILTDGMVQPTDMISGTYTKLEAATLLPPKIFLDTQIVGKVIK